MANLFNQKIEVKVRSKSRNNYTVLLNDQLYFSVCKFLSVNVNDENVSLAIGYYLKPITNQSVNNSVPLDYIRAVKKDQILSAVNCSCI